MGHLLFPILLLRHLCQGEGLEVCCDGEVKLFEVGEALGGPLKRRRLHLANWSLQRFNQLDDAPAPLLQCLSRRRFVSRRTNLHLAQRVSNYLLSERG